MSAPMMMRRISGTGVLSSQTRIGMSAAATKARSLAERRGVQPLDVRTKLRGPVPEGAVTKQASAEHIAISLSSMLGTPRSPASSSSIGSISMSMFPTEHHSTPASPVSAACSSRSIGGQCQMFPVEHCDSGVHRSLARSAHSSRSSSSCGTPSLLSSFPVEHDDSGALRHMFSISETDVPAVNAIAGDKCRTFSSMVVEGAISVVDEVAPQQTERTTTLRSIAARCRRIALGK